MSKYDKLNYYQDGEIYKCNNLFEDDGTISDEMINTLYISFYIRDSEYNLNISDIISYLKLSFEEYYINDIIQILLYLEKDRRKQIKEVKND